MYMFFLSLVGNKGVSNPEDMEAIKPLFNFVFYMIERARKLRLTKEVSPASMCLNKR